MANDLNGFLTVYAEENLPQLVARVPAFNAFTTDFSSDVANDGEAIVTRLPSTTYTANDTAANGYVALAATSSAVTVTLVQRDITHAFSELEWTSDPSRIYKTFVGPMIGSLVNTVGVAAMNLVSTASFSTKVISSVAGFSGSAATNVAQKLSTNNVPSEGRSLILKPTVYETLVNSISPAYSYGNASVVQDYKILNYAGMATSEYSALPANDQNLVGFGCHKSAIAMATRLPAGMTNFPGTIATVTDPTSGLSVQFREWHSADDGKFKLSCTLIYGVAVGNGSSLVTINTA